MGKWVGGVGGWDVPIDDQHGVARGVHRQAKISKGGTEPPPHQRTLFDGMLQEEREAATQHFHAVNTLVNEPTFFLRERGFGVAHSFANGLVGHPLCVLFIGQDGNQDIDDYWVYGRT